MARRTMTRLEGSDLFEWMRRNKEFVRNHTISEVLEKCNEELAFDRPIHDNHVRRAAKDLNLTIKRAAPKPREKGVVEDNRYTRDRVVIEMLEVVFPMADKKRKVFFRKSVAKLGKGCGKTVLDCDKPEGDLLSL